MFYAEQFFPNGELSRRLGTTFTFPNLSQTWKHNRLARVVWNEVVRLARWKAAKDIDVAALRLLEGGAGFEGGTS